MNVPEVILDVPCGVHDLFQPHIIMVKWWPRRWSFSCGRCNEKQATFGWFGYVRCAFCGQKNAPRWRFNGVGL